MRTSSIPRRTSETNISVSLNLDGTGNYEIETGVRFFDHMIEQFSFHSLIDITLKAEGDTQIDDHHTVEDCGIVLGQAIAEALGSKKSIVRYGHSHLVMDDALVRVVLDLSSRPLLVCNLHFTKQKCTNKSVVQKYF